MRQQLKTMLIRLTVGAVLLLIALYVFGVMSIGDGSSRWAFAAIAIFGAPTVIVVLIFLWLAYAFYPSLVQSLMKAHSVAAVKTKTVRHRAAMSGLKYLALTSVIEVATGLLFLFWFAAVGGPNQGMGRHIFNIPSDPYFDMQAGLVCLVFGALLALINYCTIKVMRRAHHPR